MDWKRGGTNIKTVANRRVTKPQRYIDVMMFELKHERVMIISQTSVREVF